MKDLAGEIYQLPSIKVFVLILISVFPKSTPVTLYRMLYIYDLYKTHICIYIEQSTVGIPYITRRLCTAECHVYTKTNNKKNAAK